MLVVAEASGSCLFLSQGASSLIGICPETLWQENITEWVHPQDRHVIMRVLELAPAQNRTLCPPMRLLNADDSWCWLSGEVVNMGHHQESPGLAFLLKQIPPPGKTPTAGTKPEEKLQQFSYIVSHHLRAPIANAQGLVNLLTDPRLADELYQEILKNLTHSVSQLDAITQDINLILSYRNQNDMRDWEKVSFEQVFGQVLQNLSVALQDCQGEIVLDVPQGYQLLTPRAYLYSILYNLISNSIKYRSPLRPLQISLQCRGSQESGTIITCEDNGLGMEMKTAEKNLFRPYKKLNQSTPGRGIGLYLVKTHVESLGGEIQVYSSPQQGTRFLIHLPA